MRTLLPKSVLLAAALLAACDQPGNEPESSETPGSEVHAAPEATRDWPAGCVLAVDDVPIFEEDVDRASAWIAMIEPQAAAPQLRRLALTNVVLPRVLAGFVAPEARAQALQEAEAQLALLRGGLFTGVPDKEGALGGGSNPVMEDPVTFQERQAAATTCATKLALEPMPMLVDDMADTANKAFCAWPERLYLIGADGKVVYTGAPGPGGFEPDELEEAIENELAALLEAE